MIEIHDDIRKYFDISSRIFVWPAKKKNRLKLLKFLYSLFQEGINYPEKQINSILNEVHSFNDPSLLRRELIEIGYLRRSRDSSSYWKVREADLDSEIEKKYLTKENIY
jgi:hypothetical protein